MEKFSKYRDPATGIAPLVYPLPASTESIPPLVSVIATPLSWLLGFIRTSLIVLLLLGHFLLVEVLMKVLLIIPPLHSVLTRLMTFIMMRLVLFLLGFAWISTESASLRRTSRSPPSDPFSPKAGDLIIANSSSYVELLYLAFRYNPYFLIPCSSLGSKASASSPSLITSYRCVSLTTALIHAGQLPERSERGDTLQEIVNTCSRPLVWFPEATTSNNRALLKFAELKAGGAASLTNAASKGKRTIRIFIMSFKYSSPTRLLPSSSYPIPSAFPLIPHLFSLTSTPFPTKLLIRKLHPSESPKLSHPLQLVPPRKEEMETIAETLAAVGRWKRTRIDWEMKAGFLEMRKASSSSNSAGGRSSASSTELKKKK